ncbi:hypothetical protein BB559_003854 [Furculomyces boomerangus]|uniref:K Homology domain-containing protein n=2 Tax=Harpellales TaxID=61421 RepID=A0A2T9YIG0_9FUNG|nr:hypothetical protein BB559_003854 [Furculomyces boomerangus]PWA00506.1 hypothetical protein BB558_003442 [Smittium angustum]
MNYFQSSDSISATSILSQYPNIGSNQNGSEKSIISYGAFEKKAFPRASSDSEDAASTTESTTPELKSSADPETTQLTIRALVSTKEAGIIIGKGGKNVADLRDAAKVKAGVSKVVPGIQDRVLSITGILENVSNAYELVAQNLADNLVTGPATTTVLSNNVEIPKKPSIIVRILISHNLMGTIIGKQGVKIKNIQDNSGARLVATKEMLPQSTERVVEIHGTISEIKVAISEVGKCLMEDCDRGVGTVLYNPAARVPTVSSVSNPYVNNPRASVDFAQSDLDTSNFTSNVGYLRNRSYTTSNSMINPAHDLFVSSIPLPPQNDLGFTLTNHSSLAGSDRLLPPHLSLANRLRSQSVSTHPRMSFHQTPEIHTQEISIPGDMVGCIIGKGGTRISEIRRISGSRIEIAKSSDPESGERLFTISGTSECNEKALYLLYGQLEAERERRLANARLAANFEQINELQLSE